MSNIDYKKFRIWSILKLLHLPWHSFACYGLTNKIPKYCFKLNKLNYWLYHKRQNPIWIICGLFLFLDPTAAQIRLLLVVSNQIPNSYMNTISKAYTSIHTTFLFLGSTNSAYTAPLGPTGPIWALLDPYWPYLDPHKYFVIVI